MVIYLLVFMLSTFSLILYSKTKNRFLKKIFLIFSILLPSILAGCRAEGIGTDTKNYVKNVFYELLKGKSVSYLMEKYDIEYGYIIVNFIITKFTNNINFVYFISSLIIQFFTFLSCKKLERECPIWFSYLLFLLLYYNRSLNMIRQSISISIILYAYLFFKVNNFKSIFLILFAMLFHDSAIIGLILFLIIKTINSNFRQIKKIIILSFLIILILLYQPIMKYFISNNIINYRYRFYTSGSSNIINIDYFLEMLIFAITVLSRRIIKKYEIIKDLNYVIFLGFILYHLGFISQYSQRFSYYFLYFSIFTIPQFSKRFYGIKQKKVINFLIIFIAVLYWIYYYGILGADQTVPYIFKR